MDTVRLGPALAVLLVVLVAAGAWITRVAGLGPWAQPVTASIRAVLQLGVISLIIAVVLRSSALTALFLAGMVVAAAGTSARRITGSLRPSSWWTALPITAAAVPIVVMIAVSGAVPLAPVAVLPIAGILIGGAMTATSLAGRRVVDELDSHRGAYEAALSIGLSRRDAVALLARPAAATSLVPGLDQTRTVGLVTLPGAFVGVLLAGASPWQAGATQLLVLVALVLVQVAAVAVTVELFSAGLLPVAGGPLPQ